MKVDIAPCFSFSGSTSPHDAFVENERTALSLFFGIQWQMLIDSKVYANWRCKSTYTGAGCAVLWI